MIRRDARPDDDHFGKYNGLGGKLELDESVVEGARRELREEASVELDELTRQGIVETVDARDAVAGAQHGAGLGDIDLAIVVLDLPLEDVGDLSGLDIHLSGSLRSA